MNTQRIPYGRIIRRAVVLATTQLLLWVSLPSWAQDTSASAEKSADEIAQLKKQVEDLRQMVLSLQQTVVQMQASGTRNVAAATPAGSAGAMPGAAVSATAGAAGAAAGSPPGAAPAPAVAGAPAQNAAPPSKTGADFLRGMTINALLDTYYEYNFNDPIGRVNLLRAYDVSSNSFSLNQADLVVESAPDMTIDKRVGMRIDLQFGQATSTLQGNPANELRPEIYRNIFQAYGSYWVPINGSLLALDFGKWASPLGIEGNYTKDQMNYSRSFWFNFLPFYHMGLRASYKLNDQLTFNYWITNGTEQTEAFNNFKDQLVGVVLQPTKNVSWTLQYYLGQEHPDVRYITNPGPGQLNLPQQQGTAFAPITNPPNGRLRIADTYLTWQATSALTLAGEADYVTSQLYTYSPDQIATGGALYARYQLTPKLWLAARGEYFADKGGLFSGTSQYLKEGTFTAEYQIADGFLGYVEWRRDASNKPHFLTQTLYVYDPSQTTLGFGFVWWVGQKEGAW